MMRRVILGVFLVGVFLKRVSQPPALIGMLVSMACMLYIYLKTNIAWTWYVLIGSGITLIVAGLTSFAFATAAESRQDELAPPGIVE